MVPTMISSGEGINVVPGSGELSIDMRADDEASFEPVIESIPDAVDGVRLEVERLRLWPGMDMGDVAAGPLERASRLLGRPIAGTSRGGASDASNLAPYLTLAIDGLGPARRRRSLAGRAPPGGLARGPCRRGAGGGGRRARILSGSRCRVTSPVAR